MSIYHKDNYNKNINRFRRLLPHLNVGLSVDINDGGVDGCMLASNDGASLGIIEGL